MFIKLVVNELIKIGGKWRTAIGFAALAILMPLILWGFSVGGPDIQADVVRSLEDNFLVVGSLFNGFLATYMVMNFLWVHIPFLITLVAGDIVAAEGAAGTSRIYYTRPISRAKILAAKLAATGIYTSALIFFFALMSLGLGSLWLGTGDLVVFHDGILILPPEMAWSRFALAFVFATIVMFVVALLCFLFSVMVNNGIGPIIGAMSIVIVGLAIANIPLEIFKSIKPYLFTSYFNLWQLAFHDPISWGAILESLGILGGYSAVFIAISYWIFIKRDILT